MSTNAGPYIFSSRPLFILLRTFSAVKVPMDAAIESSTIKKRANCSAPYNRLLVIEIDAFFELLPDLACFSYCSSGGTVCSTGIDNSADAGVFHGDKL